MNAAQQNTINLVKRLNDELDDLDRKRNIININEFQLFIPLFNKTLSANLDKDAIEALSKRFSIRFNLYDEIKVIDNDNQVLFIIPKLLLKMESVNKDNIHLVESFRNNSNSDIPKYIAEGMADLMTALNNSQIDENKSYTEFIKEETSRYDTLVNGFKNDDKHIHTDNIDETKTMFDSALEKDIFVWK